MNPNVKNIRSARVEFAAAADLDAMAGLLTELFTQEEDFRPERGKQLAGLRLILENPEIGQLFVLRVDGHVVGMANALITISTAEGKRVVLLEDVIVKAAFRGRELGRHLIDSIYKWAKERDFSRITLLTDKSNKNARRFYARMGFDRSAMRVLRKTVF
ncbi:MAG: GNAT family N-acetyltransferase [Candidatus Accumulibacter sp.]|jgi:GNAT superfamily N-acetyltransferase|nr:GNAT family N-acetyltransferase [Accumulibacter sp.]